MTNPFYLVDASIYIFQAYFSPHMQVVGEDGRDLSAFMGYAQFLQRFLRHARPVHLAVAFDESLFSGFRHTLYPPYKSNRVLPDPDLERQLIACADLTAAMGIRGFGSKHYEADDIIGTLAARFRRDTDGAVCIVTRDKDLSQLLRHPQDHVWDFHGNQRRYAADIQRHYGIRPEQFPDYLGLVGDAVDCIPGVPGIGPVAASALLQHFPSLSHLYENLGEVAQLGFRGAKRAGALLETHREQAFLSRTLATIVDVAPEPDQHFATVPCSELVWTSPCLASVEELLQTLALDAAGRARYLRLLEGLAPQLAQTEEGA